MPSMWTPSGRQAQTTQEAPRNNARMKVSPEATASMGHSGNDYVLMTKTWKTERPGCSSLSGGAT